MYLSLEQILMAVAKDKGLSNPCKWVEERLSHCEVQSDYYNYIHLKSHKRMWFGVRDTKFECMPFILYREAINTEEKPMKEFEIYTFKTLEDPTFFDLIKESFQYNYDCIKEVRLFYELTRVDFRIKTEDGVACLGEYNDLDEGFGLDTSLYCLTIKDSNIFVYSVHRERLDLDLIKLRLFFKETEEGVYSSDIVIVSKMGVPIEVELIKEDEDGQEWSVRWYECD